MEANYNICVLHSSKGPKIKGTQKRKETQSNSPLGNLMQSLQWNPNTTVFDEVKDMLEELIDQQKFSWLNQQMRSAQLLTEVDP